MKEKERGRESAPRVAAKQQRSARHDDCSANLVTEEDPRRLRRAVERATTPRALRDSLLLRGMRGIVERSFLRPARAYEQMRSISMAYGDDPPFSPLSTLAFLSRERIPYSASGSSSLYALYRPLIRRYSSFNNSRAAIIRDPLARINTKLKSLGQI